MQSELSKADRKVVNNEYYDHLGSAWHDEKCAPVELLRAEGKLKNKWIIDTLNSLELQGSAILDVGCGGGFLTNHLAKAGYRVTGVDLSASSLAEARKADVTNSVDYVRADAYTLPFEDQSFPIVTCMDFLEHVSQPMHVIEEISRVLQPNGLFFYHTFSRNAVAKLIAIKGVEWFVQGTPEKLHAYELFISPRDLTGMMTMNALHVVEERGLRPCLNKSFWKLLATGQVDKEFCFKWTESKLISYAGIARKH